MLPCPLQSVDCHSRLIITDSNSIAQRLLAGRIASVIVMVLFSSSLIIILD